MSSYGEVNRVPHLRGGRVPLPGPSLFGPEVVFGNQQISPRGCHEPGRRRSPSGCALRAGGGNSWQEACLVLPCVAWSEKVGKAPALSTESPPAAPSHLPCSLLPQSLPGHFPFWNSLSSLLYRVDSFSPLTSHCNSCFLRWLPWFLI